MFRRRAVPSYTGGLPGGYGYINNAISGTPAPVVGARVGGPDEDTLYVGLGEDAKAENVNRGLDALSQNTDALDDTLRRDLAVPVRHTTNSVLLPVGTYLGPTGTPSSAVGYRQLFTVVDVVTGQEARVLNVPCAVTAVTLGGGDTVGSDLFSASTVSLTISPTPPNNFSVLYYGRSNQALHLRDVWFNTARKAEQGLWSYLESSIYATPAAVSLVGTGLSTASLPAGALIAPTTPGFTGTDFTACVITDAFGRRLRSTTDVTGEYIYVVSIAAGAVDAEGFTTTTRLITLSEALPVGMAYVIHYGTRKSLLLSGVANTDVLTALHRNLYISAQQTFRDLPETVTSAWFFSSSIEATSNAWNLHQLGGNFGNVDNPTDFLFTNATVYFNDSSLEGTDTRFLMTLDPDYVNSVTIPATGELRVVGPGNLDVFAPTLFMSTVGVQGDLTATASVVVPTTSSVALGPKFSAEVTGLRYVVDKLWGMFLGPAAASPTQKSLRPISGEAGVVSENDSVLLTNEGYYSDCLDLPNGSTITGVSSRIDPTDAASTRYGVRVDWFDILTGVLVGGTALVRDALTGVSYTTEHTFTATLADTVVDRALYTYRLAVVGDNLGGVHLTACSVIYSMTRIDLRYV